LLVPHESIQHEFYFKGDIAERILPHIDGESSIEQIASASGVEVYKIHAFLKYLVKIGIVEM
jgi:predicted transcriptional regulator